MPTNYYHSGPLLPLLHLTSPKKWHQKHIVLNFSNMWDNADTTFLPYIYYSDNVPLKLEEPLPSSLKKSIILNEQLMHNINGHIERTWNFHEKNAFFQHILGNYCV